uniref:Pectinesterase inhibitor domain-containing protein n=1 Tax=Kalanchoe fedtschenkoi TaxID=63787 RepID=A0A7N1A002_KALFE
MAPHLRTFLLLLLLSAASTGAQTGSQLVTDVCDATSFSDFCRSVLLSDPRSSAADLAQLGAVAIHLTRSNATSSLAFIQSLAASAPGDQRLEACEAAYRSAVASVGRAEGMWRDGDLTGVTNAAFEAVDDSFHCADAFGKDEAAKSPLVKNTRDLEYLSHVVLVLCDVRQGPHSHS